jgi:Transposase, Mutator family
VSLLVAIGVNGQRRGLSGDSQHLRRCQGRQGGVERLPQAPQGTWPQRYPANHLGRLHGVVGERRGVLPGGGLAALHCALVPHHRTIFSHVPSTKVREIAAMLKAIHAGEDIVAARQKAVQVIEKLRGLRLTTAAELVAAAVEETLAYYAFPEEHWRRIRSARAHPARDQAAHSRRRRIPRRAGRAQPCRGQVAPYRRHCLVDQTLSQHRAAEGPADERCHLRLSQCRAPLSPKPNVRKTLDTTRDRLLPPAL